MSAHSPEIAALIAEARSYRIADAQAVGLHRLMRLAKNLADALEAALASQAPAGAQATDDERELIVKIILRETDCPYVYQVADAILAAGFRLRSLSVPALTEDEGAVWAAVYAFNSISPLPQEQDGQQHFRAMRAALAASRSPVYGEDTKADHA